MADNIYKISYQGLRQKLESLGFPEIKIIRYRACYHIAIKGQSDRYELPSKNKLNFDFIPKELLSFIDLNSHDQSLFKFILKEFTQGCNSWERTKRLLSSLFPVIIFNPCIYFYADGKSLNALFIGLLTALSIFVSIFSTFVINANFRGKESRLFENGKLIYYSSVDKNIVRIGITAIFACLVGILLSKEGSILPTHCWICNMRLILLWFCINISFIITYILLRSIVEFYISRPSEFRFGELKNKSLNDFKNNIK